jgi:hypothetical protein
MANTNDVVPGSNVLKVSIPLILLVIGVSLVGLLYPEIYKAATPNWLTQSVGQDTVDLFLIVPVLITGTYYSFASSRVAVYLWLGTLLYLVYTFVIYCFTVRFNLLFIPYCLILGLSFFSLVWFFSGDKKPYYGNTANRILGIVGVYFIVLSILFYSLWLIEVIPATINNEIPSSTKEAGLYTNPVHVLDLSLFLPATFVIGVMAIRRTIMSTLLSPVMLTFFTLMNLTIAGLSVMMKLRDVGGSYTVATVMVCMAVFSLLLLVGYIRNEES